MKGWLVMQDNLQLLSSDISLSQRYDEFIRYVSTRTNSISEFVANDLGIEPWEVDVFFELGELEPDEFDIIDEKGFDIGHLFIIVRANKRIRRIIYDNYKEVLESNQPLAVLTRIVTENSSYSVVEKNVQLISAGCYKVLASYLKDTDIVNGTITKLFRPTLIKASQNKTSLLEISEPMVSWIIRAIYHDKEKMLGIFTNELIKKDFPRDYNLIMEIRDNIDDYVANE